MSETDPNTDARSAERRIADAPSTMRTGAGDPRDVVVLDISRSGVRIQSEARLGIGQEISIGLAGAGVTRAFVSWARGDEYGCAFERPMAPEEEALAFSHAPVTRLGHAPIERQSDDDAYLRDLYRKHRVWALPWDAVLMTLAMGVLVWTLLHI